MNEKENIYYTPKIEELFVGYECEFALPRARWEGDRKEEYYDWVKDKLGQVSLEPGDGLDTEEMMIKEERIRTQFLTKEQIEGEGYILKHHSIDNWYEKEGIILREDGHHISKLFLNHGYQGDNRLLIKASFSQGPNFEDADTLFEGTCPSINEFRTIMKLLGI